MCRCTVVISCNACARSHLLRVEWSSLEHMCHLVTNLNHIDFVSRFLTLISFLPFHCFFSCSSPLLLPLPSSHLIHHTLPLFPLSPLSHAHTHFHPVTRSGSRLQLISTTKTCSASPSPELFHLTLIWPDWTGNAPPFKSLKYRAFLRLKVLQCVSTLLMLCNHCKVQVNERL